MAIALTANLTSFVQIWGYWGDWIYTHQQTLTVARQASDSQREGKTLDNLGIVY